MFCMRIGTPMRQVVNVVGLNRELVHLRSSRARRYASPAPGLQKRRGRWQTVSTLGRRRLITSAAPVWRTPHPGLASIAVFAPSGLRAIRRRSHHWSHLRRAHAAGVGIYVSHCRVRIDDFDCNDTTEKFMKGKDHVLQVPARRPSDSSRYPVALERILWEFDRLRGRLARW